ncbi:type I 3-dehydroquinate dehydratase [Candidatus Methylacidiphilum infernorum]|uniref:3-dehydroquinate dehydratase n=1 Tax=Methylacidiphilum infernorum (isolate V4) TaxID=481448 RepID=B3DWV4_METI4|nr:type I 3-dehydroquinate dehydratase [Candidatus Methylacidiphilum infernorum]ACD83767.1 3-dehydroquinate dehydratase [Methylacidiphilum infernorum V4]
MNLPIEKSLIIVGSISTRYGVKTAFDNHLAVDLLEYRLDSILLDMNVKEALEELQSTLGCRTLPALLTIRSKKEGGMLQLSDGQRIELFERLYPFVDSVDLEWQEFPKVFQVYSLYKKGGKKIILSIHSLDRFLNLETLLSSLPEIKRLEADFVKLAVRIEELSQLKTLTNLFFSYPDIPWALMGIGKYSTLSRIVLSALGSRLVYGYVDRPAALGQPSVFDLKESFQRLGIIGKER